jgi:predicted CoA-binding protein
LTRRRVSTRDDGLARRILATFKTIAVVGLSRNPAKAAHAVPAALQSAGYRVIPVNPWADQILGERAYPSLAAVPDQIEIVEVFRPSSEARAIARQAVEVGAKAVWLQLGLRSSEAKAIAEQAGLLYVEDRCMGVERAVLGMTVTRT